MVSPVVPLIEGISMESGSKPLKIQPDSFSILHNFIAFIQPHNGVTISK